MSSRLKLIIAGLALLGAGIYAFENRDIPSKGQRFAAFIVFGPVTRIKYTGDGGNTPARRDETDVLTISETGGSTADFCGDVRDRFEVGKSYRAKVVRIEHDLVIGNGTESETCLRLKDLEILSSTPMLKEAYGTISSVSNEDEDNYAFDVQMKNGTESTTLRLCNEELQGGVYVLAVLREVNNYNASHAAQPLKHTIFYNANDEWKRYSCYPMIALRNDWNNSVVGTKNISRYYNTDVFSFVRGLPPHVDSQK